MWWSADGQIPRAAYERLQTHHNYGEAARALSTRMLAAAHEDKALDGIAKDVGRYLVAQWAVYLHASGGLTLPRLKQICAASGFLSPGRARAVLLYLRYLGYVAPTAVREAGTPVRYAPTPALVAAWKRLIHEGLESVRMIEPAADVILLRLDDPEILETFLRHQGEGFLAAASAHKQDAPFFRVFAHRHAGMQILHAMIREAGPADGFPPNCPISVSIASLARQLRVSRTHIKRLLKDAEKEDFLLHGSEGAVLFSERLRSDVRYVFSTILIGLLICGAKTARDAIALRKPLALSA